MFMKGGIDMYKVLLIEDDSRIREIVTTYFQKREIIVDEAMDGYTGLSMINESYQVILLDIMMPGINGIEVCKRIRTQYNIPIVFISAVSEEEIQLEAYQIGADDYIAKPFLPSLLYAKCLAIIKRQVYMHQIKTFNHFKNHSDQKQLFSCLNLWKTK